MREIIVAPFYARLPFLKKVQREKDFHNLRFISKDDLISSYYGAFLEESVPYLIKKNKWSLAFTKEIMRYLPFVNENKNYKNKKLSELKAIKKDLIENGFYQKDSLLLEIIKEKEVKIHFYKNNHLIEKILNSRNTKFSYEEVKPKKINYLKLSNPYEECLYVLSLIGEKISSDVSPNKIHVSIKDSNLKIIFKSIAKNYNINVNDSEKESLLSFPLTQRVLTLIKKGEIIDDDYRKSLLEEYKNSEKLLDQILELYMTYNFSSFTNEEKYNLFRELFTLHKVKNEQFLKAIKLNDSLFIGEDEYLFILNFSQDYYPFNTQDNSYLNDEEKKEIGYPISEEENLEKNAVFFDLLSQNTNIFLSFSENNNGEKSEETPLIKSLKLNVLSKEKLNIYSDDESLLYLSKLKDYESEVLIKKDGYDELESKINIEGKYKVYSNKFNWNKAKFPSLSPIELSYSSVDTFYHCPFRYYLDKVLNIKEEEDTSDTLYGKLVHKVFEDIANYNADFDELWDKALNANKEIDQNDIFLPRIKQDTKLAFEKFKAIFHGLENPSFSTEQKFRKKINANLLLKGTSDLVLTFGQKNEYVIYVDYKLKGSDPTIDLRKLEYGLDMQLPTYALLEGSDPKNIAGFYFLRLNSDKVNIAKTKPNKFQDKIKLIGYTSSEIDSIDLKNVKSGKNKCLTSEEIQKYIDLVKKKYLEAASRIKKGEFEIRSVLVDGDDYGCNYCPYADICYRDDSNYLNLNIKVENDENELE